MTGRRLRRLAESWGAALGGRVAVGLVYRDGGPGRPWAVTVEPWPQDTHAQNVTLDTTPGRALRAAEELDPRIVAAAIRGA